MATMRMFNADICVTISGNYTQKLTARSRGVFEKTIIYVRLI
jgi:hypothetical protein